MCNANKEKNSNKVRSILAALPGLIITAVVIPFLAVMSAARPYHARILLRYLSGKLKYHGTSLQIASLKLLVKANRLDPPPMPSSAEQILRDHIKKGQIDLVFFGSRLLH